MGGHCLFSLFVEPRARYVDVLLTLPTVSGMVLYCVGCEEGVGGSTVTGVGNH